jgi:hypothetical protein
MRTPPVTSATANRNGDEQLPAARLKGSTDLAAASLGGSLAYLQTDYFGGQGWQGSVLWIDGKLVLRPEEMWAVMENR